ncbi:palmitoyltransferase PFA5 [Sodiomyces alkalinus F11]|uniref:Palmitoyltransferase n=1 Tax=Sodiomyces alkalinus (strain CBS 110278 / VKM F-3762 / F11) TaxID=1314773 RepID=A0A3N2Q4E9_SODAK|nr:palmitoyltransferase PFA5 [Sodiomyces alkalinus F11]ROT41639.1 palmitoyltransferase PFA5 [Sodiomyces alkalinus F11]
MPEAQSSQNAVARWTSRAIPIVLVGALGYATYVIVSPICIDYLYRDLHDPGAVIAILILYFLFFFPTVLSYIRTIWIIKTNTGLVPLGPHSQTVETRPHSSGRGRGGRRKQGDPESQPYYTGPDQDLDSPGLENFYSKDAFICESDGRPRWCSVCRNWKPDRAHHSSELGRCVRKMDHYCPWVGGMVSETSFKFFTQSMAYCALLCAVVLGASAYALAMQSREGRTLNGNIIAATVLSAFFLIFTFTMSATSIRLILLNLTNIDTMKKRWVHQLAVRVPRSTPPTNQYGIVTYPLQNPSPPGPPASNGQPGAREQPISPRDRMATNAFAILRTQADENPWDLGWKENWKEVMGTNPLDWLLPIRMSPCAMHDHMVSDYRMDCMLRKLTERYGLKTFIEGHATDVEMGEVRRTESGR